MYQTRIYLRKWANLSGKEIPHEGNQRTGKLGDPWVENAFMEIIHASNRQFPVFMNMPDQISHYAEFYPDAIVVHGVNSVQVTSTTHYGAAVLNAVAEHFSLPFKGMIEGYDDKMFIYEQEGVRHEPRV